MKKLILLSILFLSCSLASFACSCGSETRITFCYSVSRSWTANSPTIIQCVKVDYGVHYDQYNFKKRFMKVKVLQTLHGQSKSDTIIVFGDNSPMCLDDISQFKIKDTLILLGGNSDTSGIYLCGRDYLRYSKGIVSGNINSYPKETSMPLDSFLSFLQSASCKTSNIIENQQLKNSIIVAPNPGYGTFYLNTSQPIVNAEIKIYNTEGKLVLKGMISTDANCSYPIDLSSQSKGLYFISINDGNNEMSNKIIKF